MNNTCDFPDGGDEVDINDMYSVEPYKLSLHNMVCEDCYNNLESEDAADEL